MAMRGLRTVLIVGFFGSIVWVKQAVALSFTGGATQTVDTVIGNIAATIPNFTQLITAIAYVMGMVFMIKGILALKKFGEQRTQMSSEVSVMPALLCLFVGAALCYLPSAIDATATTLFSTPNPYAYVTTKKDTWDQLVQACIQVIQLIGAISFIRGLVMLSSLGGHNQHQGGLGKAMAHIVGGILCIDLWDFLSMVANTFGMSLSAN